MIQHVLFYVYFFSPLNIMLARTFYITVEHLFSLWCILWYEYSTMYLFILVLMDIWIVSSLGIFKNSASGKCLLEKFCFHFLWVYTQKQYSWSQCVPVFIFSRYCQKVLQSAYTNLYFHQNCMSLLVVLLPLQHFILFTFFSHFVGCLVILNCGFNLYFSGNSEVQHLYQYWPFVYFLCEVHIPGLAHFSIGLTSFFLLIWRISLYIMDVNISIYFIIYVYTIYIYIYYYKYIILLWFTFSF